MTDPIDLTTLTVDLLSAYVANNNLRSGDLPTLIASTHAALTALNAKGDEPESAATPEFKGAVSSRKSLGSRDFIISMIDGKPYKTLKRHLSGHGLSPEAYRERYGLAPNYPMVAPGYSEQRRDTAKRLRLGHKPKQPVAVAEAPIAAPPAARSKPGRKPRTVKQDASAD